jgi:hypothetical protein
LLLEKPFLSHVRTASRKWLVRGICGLSCGVLEKAMQLAAGGIEGTLLLL